MSRVETVFQSQLRQVGSEVGSSPWVKVDQNMIDRFADVNLDPQFIHIDAERAKTEKQFGRVWASKRIAIANRLGKMGEIIKVAGSHSLRKAAAHNLFDRSQDLRLVQSLLKHKNIATTSKYLGLEEQEALSKAIHVLGY